MSRRRVMNGGSSKLPYTPIQWIGSQSKNANSGTHTLRRGTYIKTGIFPRSDCRIEMRFTTKSTQVGWTSFFGMMFQKNATKKVRTHLIYESAVPKTETAYMESYYSSATSGITVPLNSDIVMIYDNGVFSVNGKAFTAPNIGAPIPSSNELILLDHYLWSLNGDVNNLTASVELKSVIAQDVDGVKLLDLISCKLNSSNEAGLWDLVSDRFLGASNNPSQPPLPFVAGDEIQSPID